ncbi:MAG: hypothetical protein ABL982_19580, partial [Vicinamibacterales bacterium]
MSHLNRMAVVAAMVLAIASPAMAQLAVSANDLQRLQDSLGQASSEVQQLRGRDAARAGALDVTL